MVINTPGRSCQAWHGSPRDGPPARRWHYPTADPRLLGRRFVVSPSNVIIKLANRASVEAPQRERRAKRTGRTGHVVRELILLRKVGGRFSSTAPFFQLTLTRVSNDPTWSRLMVSAISAATFRPNVEGGNEEGQEQANMIHAHEAGTQDA